jgi:hypothetical protein
MKLPALPAGAVRRRESERKMAGMTKLQIAHIREQGVDLIIVPLDKSFAAQTAAQQQGAIDALRMSASLAGLAGDVVPVWDTGDNRMGFLAHKNYHPYFVSISLEFVYANLNKELYV